QLLAQAKDTVVSAQAHQDLPFEQVVDIVKPDRSLSHTPLFQAMLAWQNTPDGELSLSGLELSALETEHRTAQFDLTLTLQPTQEGIVGSLEYATALFNTSTVERFIGYWQRLLEAMADAPADSQVGQLRIIDAIEREHVLEALNDTARDDYPNDVCIHELFEARVRHQPEDVALIFEAQRLSYAELNERANQLAHHLIALGVGPDQRVAVCLERSIEMVVSLMAILKAGGAYVPLDPAYPIERLSDMLDDCKPAVVLLDATGTDVLNALAATQTCAAPFVHLDETDAWQQHPTDNPQRERLGLNDRHLAYVIYTSGSTGRPKGVMNEHRGVVNRLVWMQEAYGLTSDDVVLQKTPFSFDVSVWEFFWPLLAGASLVMARPDGHKDPHYLLDQMRRTQVTTLHFVPSMLQVFVEHISALEGCALKRVMCSGEALPSALVKRFHQRYPGVELHNLYGPTEAAIDVTAWACKPGDAGQSVSIGAPIANTRMYILDAYGEPVPMGVAGELFIGGVQVARGYLNQAELTAERFLADPFVEGGRMYKSGDLGRWLPDGTIEYLGRNDFQVKIRGFRIELGEIEAKLAQHEKISEAVVVAREQDGTKQLIAYTTGEGELEAEAIRSFAQQRLPGYMVPSAYVRLDAFPLTPNGKLDRKALPAPDEAAYVKRAYEAPQGEVEETLAQLWRELLGVEQVGRQDNFFELGGHSLMAVQLVSRLRTHLDVEIPLNELFAHPQLMALAERIAQGEHSQLSAIAIAERNRPLPLSLTQQRMWFLTRMDGASEAYHIGGGVLLSGALDIDVLRRALSRIVARHETLRTRYQVVGDEAVQIIDPEGDIDIEHVDLRSRADAATQLEQLSASVNERPFVLESEWPIRVLLVQLSDDEHILQVTLHHIAGDGWSIGLLLDELSRLYGAFSVGQPDPLEPMTIQYADYSLWQRKWLKAGESARQANFWKKTLSGVPTLLELPTDRPRPARQDYRGGYIPLSLDHEFSAQIDRFSQKHGVTVFMTLLASWAAVLGRLSGETDIVIGSPVAGRNRVEVERLIGFFVNTLALRIDLNGAPSVESLLAQTKRQVLDAQAHQDLPFEQVVEVIKPERSTAHPPLFQIMFAWQNMPEGDLDLPELQLSYIDVPHTTAQFDLTLTLGPVDNRIAGGIDYAIALYDRETVDRFTAHWLCLLRSMIAAPGETALSRLAILSEREFQDQIYARNATQKAYPATRCIHHLFEERISGGSDSIAVTDGMAQLSYRSLNARANRLANYLIDLGVAPGQRVGLCMDRSADMVVALLAIFKAGGAYVPLDPSYPVERLGYILEDSKPSVVLTRARVGASVEAALSIGAARYSGAVRIIDLEGDAPDWAEQADSNPFVPSLTSRHLAYVIYTSGSTGQP
ncbi:non-ribosomal peptide synthetase, partial [Denitromonas iodatirespirans]